MFNLLSDECDDKEISNELSDLDNALDNAEQTCDSIEAIEMSIESSGEVDRHIMKELQEIVPEVISPQYPLSSYTASPSNQNLEVSLEAGKLGKFLQKVAIGAIIAAWIYSIFKFMTKKSISSRIDHLGKAHQTRKETLELLAKAGFKVDEIFTNLKKDRKSAPQSVKNILKLMTDDSDAMKILSNWLDKYPARLKAYISRIDTMLEVLKKSKNADQDTSKKLIDMLQREQMDADDALMKDMVSLKTMFAPIEADKPSKKALLDSTEYMDYLNDFSSWALSVSMFMLSGSGGKIDKAFKDITKKANDLKSAQQQFNKDLLKPTSTKQHESTTEVNVSGINVDLVRALNVASKELKAEASAVAYLYGKLDSASLFYLNAYDDMDKFMNKAEKASAKSTSK